jgi:hypothetical protein
MVMHVVNFKADETLIALIDGYAKANNIERSDAIRTLIAEGGSNIIMLKMQEDFDNLINSKNNSIPINDVSQSLNNCIFFRDNYTCQRCHNKNIIYVYHIDKNTLNNDWNNLITLCDRCCNEAGQYTPKNRARQDFIEWFYSIPRL